MNTEKIKQLRDLVLVCNEVGDDTAELFQYLADLLESIDKAEPVYQVKGMSRIRNVWVDIDKESYDFAKVYNRRVVYAHPPKTPTGVQQEQSPKVAPTVAIDERAEFEKWANKHKGGEPLQLGGGGTYPNPFANAAYEAWQAARKLSAPDVLDKFNPADWLWAWLADYCKSRGINPHHSDLFKACSDMRAAMRAHCDAMLKGEK